MTTTTSTSSLFKNPTKILMQFPKRVSDLDWRLLLLLLPPLSLLLYVSVSSAASGGVLGPLSSLIPIRSIFTSPAPAPAPALAPVATTTKPNPNNSSAARIEWLRVKKAELNRSRIAVCLVGGARRFELTGPSIVEKILKEYPNSDLFLHSPLDSNSYKFSLLKVAPRIAGLKIFKPTPIPETESEARVLSPLNSPNGIQGLLQYFNLVEGCLRMIQDYQTQNNFTYGWIIRTRVDGYWSNPLSPENFIPGKYVVPPGSAYGGLNDRFGLGDLNSSVVALSRLSMIPQLDSAGFRLLNSECAFKAQLTTQKTPYLTRRLPFCVITDRTYGYPPYRFGVPVAAISSPGPLSGAKCRPCTPVCTGQCAGSVMSQLDRGWSWTEWANNSIQLCDAHAQWEDGWENIFDKVAGELLAGARRQIRGLQLQVCVNDFEAMRNRTAYWETPPVAEICQAGLGSL